ncbi:LysE family transporter [Synechococcales cyanobacterium C]|uniref:LysE family transporter n=1 Tax=Petrachloros mirabilis ULC683 TaxID=2781853 RepID=A0A8K1ZVB5_9CYAN|nr:LysE family translocator [Petrachloros mirabilis]NCJ05850.1 LysE family transporter [Petrachloros mirabilis ULC683]
MTWGSTLALFTALVMLAAIPSVSVFVVSTRSATLGLGHGVFTALGIVMGDVIFIGMALGGWSLLLEHLGPLASWIRPLGGAYLIWLGIGWLRASATKMTVGSAHQKTAWQSSFLAGLAITLGDQKAMLFYLGFLPAFVNMETLSYLDAGIIIATAMVAVGGVKLVYAWMADRASLLFNWRIRRIMGAIAGSILIATGLFLIVGRVGS